MLSARKRGLLSDCENLREPSLRALVRDDISRLGVYLVACDFDCGVPRAVTDRGGLRPSSLGKSEIEMGCSVLGGGKSSGSEYHQSNS